MDRSEWLGRRRTRRTASAKRRDGYGALGGRFRELDVPLLVEWADGRRDAVLFALEEESDWRTFSAHRLAHYCLDLPWYKRQRERRDRGVCTMDRTAWLGRRRSRRIANAKRRPGYGALADMLGTDRVVPVVIFLRDAGRAPASLALGTERHSFLTFDYIACKLAEMPAESWLDSDNVVARVNLPNMRSPREHRVEVYARAVRGLLELEPDRRRREKYLDFIDIYAGLTDNERRRYRRQYPEESSTMAGMFQRAREEGMQQGVQQGIERGVQQGIEQGIEQGMNRGRVEGERALLRRQLRRRFGVLSPETVERVDQASARDLESWAENVLDAGTLDEVFDSNP